MKVYILVFLLFFGCFSFAEESIDILFQVGTTRELDGSYSDTNDFLAAVMDGLSSARSNYSYSNFGAGNVYYALYSDLQIRAFDLGNKQYLGEWLISWWPETALESAIVSRYRFVNYSYDDIMMGVDHPLGCLREVPLRYGDLENDGKKDIYLFIGNDFFIFSPDAKKTVFQSKLRIDDWFTLEETNEQFENYSYYAKSEKRPQYLSAANPDWLMKEEPLAGYRGYAKLYFSDFDADGAFDILVWRKLYESRLNADPVKGFIKKSDLLVHYKLVNGEYKKQTTDQAVIKGWLAAKQLTWKKGYPSKSECAGQEGQLIPEMHDPLLNDPDVLQ